MTDEAVLFLDAEYGLTLKEEGGTNFVTRWNDVRPSQTTYYAEGKPSQGGGSALPFLRAPGGSTNTTGRMVVETGPIKQLEPSRAAYFAINESPSFAEAFVVAMDTEDVKTMVDKGKTGSDGRASPFIGMAAGNWLRGNRDVSGVNSSIANPVSDKQKLLANGSFELDGQTTFGGKTVNCQLPYPDGFHVLNVRPTESLFANYLSSDRGSNSNGGLRYGAVILFAKVLSAEQRVDVTDWLMRRWKGFEHRIERVRLASGATFEVDESSQLVVGNLVKDGVLVKNGNWRSDYYGSAAERAQSGVIRAARGARRFTDIASLPVTDPGARIHYEGSIDRGGYNADYCWGTYQDRRGDWVLMETDEPGCLYNFVQHRFLSHCEEPTFKFYFDGEETPRFTIKSTEFGRKAPFLAPLSGRQFWEGNAFGGCPATDSKVMFSIVRAFCPMEFRKGCKVTSTVRLEGIYPGGWGHIHYHTYPDATGLETFDPENDFEPVARRYERPLSAGFDAETKTAAAALGAGERRTVYRSDSKGAITEVALTLPHFRKEFDSKLGGTIGNVPALTNIWVELVFDGRKRVEAPLATFYGSYIPFVRRGHPRWRQEFEGTDGNMQTALLTFDMSSELGFFSNRFPMPFWRNAEVAFVNKGHDAVVLGEIVVRTNSQLAYDERTTGYFTAGDYVPMAPSVERENIFLGQLVGRGQLAYSTFAGLEHTMGGTCEGDVRLFLDTLSAPAVQSDGSESWGCWGMGFSHAPRLNPFSFYMSYTGLPKTVPNGWSLMRSTVVDCCYFDHFIRFELEHGGYNNGGNKGVYGGQIFVYLKNRCTTIP